MTRDEASELLDLIIERAPQLREAGVLSVNLGGAAFVLAAAELAAPADLGADQGGEGDPKDVLHDPWTHGRPNRDAPASLKVTRRPL